VCRPSTWHCDVNELFPPKQPLTVSEIDPF
jgi:hypothetical protein